MILEELLYEQAISGEHFPLLEYSPLKNPEALREAEISEVKISPITGRAAVLFDLRTSLQLWDLGSAGLLLFEGVETVSVDWPSDRIPGRFATPAGVLSISSPDDGRYSSVISSISSSFDEIHVESSEVFFFLLESTVVSDGTAPPDFMNAGAPEMVKGLPRMSGSFRTIGVDRLA
ncbi:hypothetical protein nbrc107696_20120 [Gordonia spumicola]|uniref:Uncharacterized protein n=1 Tax=Gordonia spumicola TaxID=589161 RepID=A0A7I9V858_9ACTN|nr:hypothetical protein [Gordonia spumicola]GEE01566.1 hypothetical protein nbrc107696_20120 [Gordonia spumicola]